MSFEGEKLLWWELDKLCVKDSAASRRDRVDLATNLMRLLEKPSPEECRQQYRMENGG